MLTVEQFSGRKQSLVGSANVKWFAAMKEFLQRIVIYCT